MATPFENFVSLELPKRIGTNTDPLTVAAGLVPVTTGVGLLTEFQPYGGGTGVSTISMTASENIGGHRAVRAGGYYADNSTLGTSMALGITTGAVSSGAIATVQTAGEMTEPSWTWDVSKPVYLGSNGLLTQTVPTSGVIIEIGKPTAATKLLIEIQQPIQLGG